MVIKPLLSPSGVYYQFNSLQPPSHLHFWHVPESTRARLARRSGGSRPLPHPPVARTSPCCCCCCLERAARTAARPHQRYCSGTDSARQLACRAGKLSVSLFSPAPDRGELANNRTVSSQSLPPLWTLPNYFKGRRKFNGANKTNPSKPDTTKTQQ